MIKGKLEKVPRGIQGEKSSKDMASSRNLVSTIGDKQVPKWGDQVSGRVSVPCWLASHTRYKCSREPTHNSMKVKIGIRLWNMMKVWSVGKSLLVKGQNVI